MSSGRQGYSFVVAPGECVWPARHRKGLGDPFVVSEGLVCLGIFTVRRAELHRHGLLVAYLSQAQHIPHPPLDSALDTQKGLVHITPNLEGGPYRPGPGGTPLSRAQLGAAYLAPHPTKY